MQHGTNVQMQVQHRVRLAKQDDAGRYTEFRCFGDGREMTVITPESDPEEFARLVALEQAGGDAE